MNKFFFFYFLLLPTLCLTQDQKNKPKYDIPIYPNDQISVTTKRGEISKLIKKIEENQKGIPAITISTFAKNIFIPPVQAERTTLGLLFKALNNYKDNVTRKELIIQVNEFSIDITAKKLPEKTMVAVRDRSKYKIVSYRVVLLREKITLKKAVPIILETYNKQWNQDAVLRYEKNDDYVYIFGLPDDVSVLTKTFNELNKIELKKKDADAKLKEIIEEISNNLFLEGVDNRIKYYEKYITFFQKEISDLIVQVKSNDANSANKIKKQIKEHRKQIKENEKIIKNLNIMKSLLLKKK